MKESILVDLERCTGCWTCSMACKMAHHLGIDDYRLSVRTIGGGRIDEPAGTWPNLSMDWMPVFSRSCTMCADRKSEGERPFCEMCCPSSAIIHGDADDSASCLSRKRRELLDRGYSEIKLPAWENTRPSVLYYKNMAAH